MEVSSGEAPKKFHASVGKVREKLWQRIEHDTLVQNVKTEWMNTVNRAAAGLDARSLARLQMTLTEQAENIGKVMAIGSNALNVVVASVLGGFGVGLGASTLRLSPGEQAVASRPVLDRALGGKKYRWEKRKPAVVASLGMSAAALATYAFRPVMRESLFAAKFSRPLVERVTRIVNTIFLKRDIKREAKKVFVGQSHA